MIELVLNLSSPSERAVLLRELNDLRGDYVITFRKGGRKRTTAQNRLFHMCVAAFKQHLNRGGHNVGFETAKELLKKRFVPVSVVNPITGEEISVVGGSTSELTVEAFRDVLDAMLPWLWEMGIRLPSRKQFEGDDSRRVRVSPVKRKMLAGGNQ